MDFKVNASISDKNGRFLILDLVIDETHLILVNIYAPNDTSQQVAFFKELNHHLGEFAQESVVIAGDFNCALSSRDKKGGNPVSKKTLVIKEIERLSNLYNLTDIWRNLNPYTDRFTWRNKSFKIQCRLDFFLISKDLINDVQSCSILNAPESDHSAITLHLRSKELKQHKGPGFWKFNSSLLEDEVYINKLRENIILFKNKYFDIDDLGLQWDLIKMEIRGFTIKYSKLKAKKRKNEERLLQNKVNELLQKSETNPNNKQLLNELFATKLRLQIIMRQKTKGAIIRSKARWQEKGERNTRYFLNLEKRNHLRKTVTKLKVGDDKYTTDQFEILEEEKTFYKSLYKSQNTNEHDLSESTFFASRNIAPLKKEEQKLCEGLVSVNECLNALKEFKNAKSPGTDGFSAEFYKFFWPELGTEMVSSFNHAFRSGTLSISQRRGIISLIPKKNKDKTLLDNLRPISLLNVDYKILTKTLAKRLEKVLPTIINPDQTGYVKDRFIGKNVRLINDIMFFTEHSKKPGIAIFLDFRKAFDTIEWNYLSAALQALNFGPDMLNWFQVLYHQVSSCVLHNGHASDFFLLERGVRQGCPLSGLLFVIGIELFARAVKNDTDIKGINVDQKEIKITQYADDTTVLVSDCDSILRLLKLLDEFKQVSGLKINTEKTEAMWLGAWKNRTEKPFGFKWPHEPILALGVYFSYDLERANVLNFEEKITTLEKTLNNWKQRKLTLMGKINIVKTLGLSKLIYSASLLSIPKGLIEKINKIIFNFIWDNKPAKIKRKTIIAEKKCGGLRMVDFEMMERSLKIAWVKRIIENCDASWKIVPEYALNQYGGLTFFIKCQYDIKLFDLQNLPEFYRTILSYWQSFKLVTNHEVSAEKQIIWNNRDILVDGKPIFYKSWVNKGIICIKDLLAEDLNFLSLTELKAKLNLEVPFTTFYGILQAIPKIWKVKLRNTVSSKVQSLSLPSTKIAYSILLSKSYLIPTGESKILNYGFTKENIQNVYMLPFRILHEPKLIIFQFKIIHNILPTQSSLFRAGIKDSDSCPLCSYESQSLLHMLFTCNISYTFWNLFTRWWHKSYQEHIKLSESVILYGWHQKSNNWSALNYALVIAKYHIFSTSVCNGILNFESFLLRLKNKISVMRTLAVANNKLEQFVKSWAPM